MSKNANPLPPLLVGNQAFPPIGFGTDRLQDEICERAIRTAFDLGYRAFDTATMYNNFEAIGKALQTINRNDVFLVSKVWPDQQAGKKLLMDLESTLQKLQVDYLDAYLLHWPDSRLSLDEIIENLNLVVAQQKVRFIGLSNVNIHHIKKAIERGFPVSVVQNEMNPHFLDTELLDFCHQKNILVQCWSPLTRCSINQDKLLLSLAQKYNKTPSQIALRWIIQHQCMPIPRSKAPNHIADNIDVFDFQLSDSDFEIINQKAKNGPRLRITEEMGMGFIDEFDFAYEDCWPK